jgi:hypothetical protein
MRICALSGSDARGDFIIFSTVPGTGALDFSLMVSPLTSSLTVRCYSGGCASDSPTHPDAPSVPEYPSRCRAGDLGVGDTIWDPPNTPSRANEYDRNFLISEMSKSGLKSLDRVVSR